MTNQFFVDRRALMGKIALLIGASALPTDLFAASDQGTERFLPPENYKLLVAVADTLIPVTDTPGALAARVPETFDALLKDWASEESRTSMTMALAAIDRRALDMERKGFANLPPDRRKSLLIAHDLAALTPVPGGMTTGTDVFTSAPAVASPEYAELKKLILSLYYSSEIGLTQELIYEHVPGQWVPSLKITPETRPFAGPGGF